jgi:hypothetical protein
MGAHRLRELRRGGAEHDRQLERLDGVAALAQLRRRRAHRLPRLVDLRPVEGGEAGQQHVDRHAPSLRRRIAARAAAALRPARHLVGTTSSASFRPAAPSTLSR